MHSVMSKVKVTTRDFLDSIKLKEMMLKKLNVQAIPVNWKIAVSWVLSANVQTQTRMVWTLKDLNKRTVVRVGLSS